MVNIPANVIERMKSMTPEQRQEVIAYYKRNDEEEKRIAARRTQKTPVDELKVEPTKKLSQYIKRPSTAPNENIKRPEKTDYVAELYESSTKPKDLSPAAKVLQTESKKRNLKKEDVKRLRTWAENVADLESEGIPDRLQNDSENGIGRGKYQFEVQRDVNGKKVGSGTAKTAANRFFNWEEENGKLNIPKKDREELKKDMPDFSKLSEETQDAVFFIHHSLHPRTPLSEIAKGEYDPKEAWVNFHWAGNPEEAPSKRNMWDSRIENKTTAKLANLANTFIQAI